MADQTGGSRLGTVLLAILTAVVTTVLTVTGEYFAEGRKANLDIWTAVQSIQLQLSQEKERRQIEALYDIQGELKILEGEFVLIAKEAKTLRSPESLKNDAAEAAKTMSRIYPRVVILDAKLRTPEAAKGLLDKLSVHVAHIWERPSKTNANEFLQYYGDGFRTALALTLKSVQEDQQQLQSASAKKPE